MTAPIPSTSLVDTDEKVGTSRRPPRMSRAERRAIAVKGRLASPWGSALAIVLAILWTIPSIGLLVTSFRPPLDIRRSGWWTVLSNPEFTLDNYDEVLFGGANLSSFFVNSIVITLPAVVIPITVALLAAYAFAWIDFKGRGLLFVAVFALQIVPIQITLIPLLSQYVDWGINGTFWTVWLSHSMFALPLAIFLLHNFISEIPSEVIEAARVDGAGHGQIFFRMILPLAAPALASFAVLEFIWVWNDLLVATIFAPSSSLPLTQSLNSLSGTWGNKWFLQAAGTFISIVVPLVVFFGLQRFFVRGLLAGATKG